MSGGRGGGAADPATTGCSCTRQLSTSKRLTGERKCCQVLRRALHGASNVARFGSKVQIQAYVDGGGLPALVGHMTQSDAEVRPGPVRPPGPHLLTPAACAPVPRVLAPSFCPGLVSGGGDRCAGDGLLCARVCHVPRCCHQGRGSGQTGAGTNATLYRGIVGCTCACAHG